MGAIVTSIEVDRPPDEVFAYATDPTRFSEWQGGVTGGRMDSAGPPAVGDVCVTSRRIGGADRAASSRLTVLDPPHTWAVRGIDGPIRAAVDVTVDATGAASARLTIAVDFEGRGIGRVLVPLMVRREATREMPENLARLKTRLES